jgi:hypothetical protein
MINDKFVYDEEITMRTLNLSQIQWIMREMMKGDLSVQNISKQQRITPAEIAVFCVDLRNDKLFSLIK